MGYKEEIFERLERDGFTSVSEIIDWLAGDKPKVFGKDVINQETSRDRDKYVALATELAEPFKLKGEIQSAGLINLNKIEKEVDSLKINKARSELKALIDSRRLELTTKFNAIDEVLIKRYEKQLNQAKTPEQVEEILNKAERDLSPEAISKIQNNANKRLTIIERTKLEQEAAAQKEISRTNRKNRLNEIIIEQKAVARDIQKNAERLKKEGVFGEERSIALSDLTNELNALKNEEGNLRKL